MTHFTAHTTWSQDDMIEFVSHLSAAPLPTPTRLPETPDPSQTLIEATKRRDEAYAAWKAAEAHAARMSQDADTITAFIIEKARAARNPEHNAIADKHHEAARYALYVAQNRHSDYLMAEIALLKLAREAQS